MTEEAPALVPAAVAGLVLFCFDPSRYHFYPVCFFHKTTGLLCAGIFVVGGYAIARGFPQWGSVGPWVMGTIYVIILGLAMWWRWEHGPWREIDLFREFTARVRVRECARQRRLGDNHVAVTGRRGRGGQRTGGKDEHVLR